ncbi:MAG: hypothetical protein HY822_09855 [Acidobacteria bacterium]|nr:hypothetical protein [Acidobacteriota bacterium]
MELRRLAALLSGLLMALAAEAQPIPPVDGMRHSAPEKEQARRLARRLLPSLGAALPRPREVRLGALSREERARMESAGRGEAKVAGVHRRLESAALEQGRVEYLDGQRPIWRLALDSADAAGVRVHFTSFDAGGGRVWVHDGRGDESEIHGPYTGRGPYGDGDFWSDAVLGENLVIEYEPGRPMDPLDLPPFKVSELAHLATGVHKAAASCNLDATCYPDWAETAKAVAHILFERDGSSYVCSGTLLNTRNGRGIPYFLTAQHCIADDATARSVNAFWSYQTPACNGVPPNRRDLPRTLGARYLAGTPVSSGDGTLLQLNGVPSGVTFSGWDANPVGNGVSVTGIHHPNGDFKRISLGNSRDPHPYPGRELNKYIGAYWNGGGLTEGGSSGSGLFSGSLQLVGMLSHGPKAETPEQYCALLPFTDNYGRFSAFYPVIRDYLEERTATTSQPPAPPPAAGGTAALVSGQPSSFSLGPVSSARLFSGAEGFLVNVPSGTARIEIVVRTTTPNADVDLYVRQGQDVVVDNGRPVADFRSEGDGGDERVVIEGSSLRPGVYYVALAVFTPNVRVQGTVTATISTGTTATALISGQPRSVSLAAVQSATLLRGANGYTISVPQGSTRLEIVLRTPAPSVDVDLFARFGQDVGLDAGSVVADFSSENADGNEQIVIAGSALRAGTYYIALAVFTAGTPIQTTLTATATSAAAPQPSGATTLVSGAPAAFRIGPVTSATAFYGNRGFRVQVPQGATRLDLRLSTTSPPDADVDLFVRYDRDVEIAGESVVADYSSAGMTGTERVTVTPQSTPPLRPGTYYIGLGLFTANVEAVGTLTATVVVGSGTAPSAPTQLTSGVPAKFSFPSVSSPSLFGGNRGFRIAVPEGSAKLTVQLRSDVPSADTDLFVRYMADNGVDSDGNILTDYAATSPYADETIVVDASTEPPLRPGTYYVSLAVYSTGLPLSGTILATIDRAPVESQGGQTVLTSNVPAPFALPAVDSATLFSGQNAFRLDVPADATRVEFLLNTEPASTDVDLFVRYGAVPAVGSEGRIVADHSSTSDSGNERISIDSSSRPWLRAGAYYVALALYTPNTPAAGALTAVIYREGKLNGAPDEAARLLPKPEVVVLAPARRPAPPKSSLGDKSGIPVFKIRPVTRTVEE